MGMFPEINTTEPYSPRERANAKVKPVSTAFLVCGKMILQKIWNLDAPNNWAASSVSLSKSSSTG